MLYLDCERDKQPSSAKKGDGQMTRKHFQAIADAIQKAAKDKNTLHKDILVAELCQFFAQENINFSSTRFIKACEGVE